MDYEHSCAFCGWRRASATPVMLVPACDRCGCALDCLDLTAELRPPREARTVVLPDRVIAAARRPALALLVGLVLYASARTGYNSGGTDGGLVALGAAGLLVLPFVPERIGTGARPL